MGTTNNQKSVTSKRRNYSIVKRLVIVILIVVVLFGAAFATWWFMYGQVKPVSKKVTINDLSKSVNDAQKLTNSGNSNAAKAAYDNILKSTSDDHTKAILLLDKALIPLNSGNYDEALNIAKEAESVEKSSYVYSFLAQIYEKKGDSENAIKYYRLAISTIDKTQPSAGDDIDYYQSKINSLSGSNN